MSNQANFDKDFDIFYEVDEYMKNFKRLTEDQQLAELSQMVAEINGGSGEKEVLREA